MTSMALPTTPQSVATLDDEQIKQLPLRARICLCGPEGTGKTTLASQWAPSTTLHLDLQHGTDLLPGEHYVQHIGSWSQFEQVIDAIVAPGQTRFKTIVVDTIDLAYKFADAHAAAGRGLVAAGLADYGKGTAEAEGLFRRSIHKLLQRRDLGVWFIGHAELVEINKRQVWTPKLDKRVREYITGDCEHVFFTEPIGDRIVLHTRASQSYNAKSRLSRYLPEPLTMDARALYEALRDGIKLLAVEGAQPPAPVPTTEPDGEAATDQAEPEAVAA